MRKQWLFFFHIESTKNTTACLLESVHQTVLNLAPFGGRSLNFGHEKVMAFPLAGKQMDGDKRKKKVTVPPLSKSQMANVFK